MLTLFIYSLFNVVYFSQSIQEWIKQNSWKATFKNLKGYDVLEADHTPSNFLKAVFNNFYLVHS